MARMKYDAVIFDKDGVLLDSMDDDYKWADEMRKNMLGAQGKEITIQEAEKLARTSSVNKFSALLKDLEINIETLRNIEKKISKRKIEKVKTGEFRLFQDTRKVLEEITLPKSVVSNAPMETTRFVIEEYDLNNHFEAVNSPSLHDLERYVELKKPNPEMLEEAIERMDARNPIMVGDSDDDIKAAKNAGIDSIFVNTNGGTDLNPTHKVQKLESILEIIN
ncbi:MAG: HAD superfamily hydrolase (TIGR01549 family) [Candidatus Nanohaloarchaea archaeon]|jgi:HAD superfamily hydrolase (TIGR01549 family)